MSGFLNRTFVSFSIFWALSHHLVTNVTYERIYAYKNTSAMFNFLSNPVNLKIINPTIINMTVSFDNNIFFVNYTEHLVQLPFITNSITATYWIIDKNVIRSQHNTSFLNGFYTVPTDSFLQLLSINKSKTQYIENITYVCPWILAKFCQNEVHQQRLLIMDNLERMYNNKSP